MKLWMDVMRDVEHLLADHERILDAWAEGGVDGLVLGPPMFNAAKLLRGCHNRGAEGEPQETLEPDPAVYRRFGVAVPDGPKAGPAPRRAHLAAVLQAARDRGFSVYFFQAQTGAGPGGGGHHLFDAQGRAATCARIVDRLEQYPMVDGAIMDGPEWGYEIATGHMNRRSYIFDDLPPSVAEGCEALGYDYAALAAARDRLHGALRNLDTRRIRLHASGGLLGALELLGVDADVTAWLRFRVDSLTAYFRGVSDGVRSHATRPVKLGVGPRSAAFAPLCGYDLARLADFMDVLLPKHYFWHRGFDGMLGSVGRYVDVLCRWNPGLRDVDALKVIRSLFGLELPDVEHRAHLEHALTPEFHQTVVRQETERALAVTEDPDRIVPWVDAGRAPHDGDPMSAADLRGLLQAAAASGLQRFLYHHHGNLTEGEWIVISELCGRRWEPGAGAYRPPDEDVL